MSDDAKCANCSLGHDDHLRSSRGDRCPGRATFFADAGLRVAPKALVAKARAKKVPVLPPDPEAVERAQRNARALEESRARVRAMLDAKGVKP